MNTNLHIAEHATATVIEGRPDTPLLQSPDDVVELIGSCFEHGSQLLLLYAENLTRRFFDLSSGEAGEILQKLRNYRIRLAVIANPERTPQSTRFRELLSDEQHGDDFRMFDEHAAALAWLLS